MTYQRSIGDKGEAIALAFLTDLGYQFLDQNYTTRYGELDLIFSDAGVIVFVEVKARTSDTFGSPESSVTAAKLERIENAALLWLQAHPDVVDDWRIDVVAVLLNTSGTAEDVQHFINVT